MLSCFTTRPVGDGKYLAIERSYLPVVKMSNIQPRAGSLPRFLASSFLVKEEVVPAFGWYEMKPDRRDEAKMKLE